MSATLRRIMVLFSGAVLAASSSFSSASASVDASVDAVDAGGVRVPPHVPTTTELQLLGRTSNGAVAVIRDGGAVLTGHPGEARVDGGASVDEPFPYSPRVHDLTGNTLRWAGPRRTGSHWVIHTVDVTGGRTTHLDSPDRVVGLTGDGWVGWDMTRLTLVRHVPGARDRTLLAGVYDPRVVADERGAAALYYPKGGGPRLVLIDFASGRVETLTDYRDRTHAALTVSGQRLTVLGSWFFPWPGVTYSPDLLAYLPRLRQLWQPEFEVSKPVTDVRLTVRRGRTVVATLTGTGTAGDVRGLSWDGRGGAGVYTYELTARGADGDGALPPVSGVVTVR